MYLGAAAKSRRGRVYAVDRFELKWQGKTVIDLLEDAHLDDVCEVTLKRDARWYLLDLFRASPGCWVHIAYLDADHSVEVDAFLALALWTHLRPGGILVLDDLDWIPAIHDPDDNPYTHQNVPHVRALYEYIARLPDVDQSSEWGQSEIGWAMGLIRKRGPGAVSRRGVSDLLEILGNSGDESGL